MFLLRGAGMNIEWINSTAKTVRYDYTTAPADVDAIEYFTERFEREQGLAEGSGEDIGGLIVYSDRCVYDYENFCGWVK
jgi:hypothetical protein